MSPDGRDRAREGPGPVGSGSPTKSTHRHYPQPVNGGAFSVGPADGGAGEAAWRCWTWRTVHGCGCGEPADCLLATPLPVHPPQPCPGQFGGNGQWQPCCRGAA
jgi:hypothetical protein